MGRGRDLSESEASSTLSSIIEFEFLNNFTVVKNTSSCFISLKFHNFFILQSFKASEKFVMEWQKNLFNAQRFMHSHIPPKSITLRPFPHCFNVNFPILKVLKTHNNFKVVVCDLENCKFSPADGSLVCRCCNFHHAEKVTNQYFMPSENIFLWAMTTKLFILGLGDETHQNLFSSSEKFEFSLHPPSTFHFPALACAALLHNYGSDREEGRWKDVRKFIKEHFDVVDAAE